jgi:Domain of unknown function (DUF222)
MFYTTGMCDGDDKSESLEELLRAIEAFVAGPAVEVTAYELGERLIRLRHGLDLLELGFAREAAVFAGTTEYEAQGSTSPIDWVRHRCAMSGNAAARSIATGEAAESLPASVAALEEGRIGFAHLALLAGTARALRSSTIGAALDDAPGRDAAASAASAGAPGFDEAPLLALALEHSVGRFSYDCTHARHAGDAAAVLAEQVTAVENRRLELTKCEDGRVAVHGIFDPVGGATVRVAMAALCGRAGAGDQRSHSRRLADALVELANHALDHGFATERGSSIRPHLQLTASVETVMGLAGAPGGDLEFAGAVPAATAQRLACDASIRRVLLDSNSEVIDVGRARRMPSPAARAALRVRDRGCVWPGCDRPASWTTAHHVRHWGHGGVSDVPNLVLLCHRHHWLVHEGGWQVVRTDGREVLAIPPPHTYRSWTRAPDGAVAR